ncbi:putative leader peptide [Streptomyces sp. TP-A0874]|nr:putative leader peptide [Streptomyces sp. TP-A0874]
MPYQPIAARPRPMQRAGARYALFLGVRFAERRHIDLQRVSSAICFD